MDPITARTLAGLLGLGASAAYKPSLNNMERGAGFEYPELPSGTLVQDDNRFQYEGNPTTYFAGDSRLPVPLQPDGTFRYPTPPPQAAPAKNMNIPAHVAPTERATQNMKTGAGYSESYQRHLSGIPAGAPLPPPGFDPNIMSIMASMAPQLAAPMQQNISDMYAPLHQQIGQSFQLGPEELPYVPPDPMANPLQAAASMGLGRMGAVLQGMPERGGEAAARVERGILANQQGQENVRTAKRTAKTARETAELSALSQETADRIGAQNEAFRQGLMTYIAGKEYDQRIYGHILNSWDNEQQRKVSLRIAAMDAAARKGDSEAEFRAKRLDAARSAIMYASNEVARQLIDGKNPEDMNIVFPVPGSPGGFMVDPKTKETIQIPPGYQGVHGLSNLDGRLMSNIQGLDNQEDRNSMAIMYTNAISSPVYKAMQKRTDAAGEAEDQAGRSGGRFGQLMLESLVSPVMGEGPEMKRRADARKARREKAQAKPKPKSGYSGGTSSSKSQ